MAGSTEGRGALNARSRRVVGVLGVVLPLLVPGESAAQPRAPVRDFARDSMAMRRTAVMSVLASRARREGTTIDVGMCSVLSAIGVAADVRRSAPAAIAPSLVDPANHACPARSGWRQGDPWIPIGEVSQVTIDEQRRGPPQIAPRVTIATIVLTVWTSARAWDYELYEFVARTDTVWAQVSFKRSRGGHADGGAGPSEGLLVIHNGTIIGFSKGSEVFDRLRDEVIESIRFIQADSSVKLYGSRAREGTVVISTHPPARRSP